MELEDLKNTWEDVNNQAEKQQNLTLKTINQMTQIKYAAGMKKIAIPETAGAIICIAAAIYIGTKFSKLDTAFLQSAGIISILILLILPVVSFLSLQRFNITGNVNKPYAETLRTFAVQKIRFYKLQKVNVTLSYLLLVTVIILLPKIFGGKDITANKYFWIFSFSFGYIFLSFYSFMVKKYYGKTLRQTEELLKELRSE